MGFDDISFVNKGVLPVFNGENNNIGFVNKGILPVLLESEEPVTDEALFIIAYNF